MYSAGVVAFREIEVVPAAADTTDGRGWQFDDEEGQPCAPWLPEDTLSAIAAAMIPARRAGAVLGGGSIWRSRGKTSRTC